MRVTSMSLNKPVDLCQDVLSRTLEVSKERSCISARAILFLGHMLICQKSHAEHALLGDSGEGVALADGRPKHDCRGRD